MQDVTNTVILPSIYCTQDIPFLRDSMQIFLTLSIQLISIPLQHHISKLSRYFWSHHLI